jgi:hypothetical protein
MALLTLVTIGACFGRKPRHGDEKAAWTGYTPTGNPAAFGALVKSLSFPHTGNAHPITNGGNVVGALISPEENVNMLDTTMAKLARLQPSGAVGRVIARIDYTDPVYDVSWLKLVHTDHSKVVYWWLSTTPINDPSQWRDYFVSVDTASGQVAAIIDRPFCWVDEGKAYPRPGEADWSGHSHPPCSPSGNTNTDTMAMSFKPGWASCGTGCCN